MDRYDPHAIQNKWQKVWADERTWEVSNDPGEQEKSYVLEMLPYPSGEPHMGHLKTYSVGDAIAHFRRRNGMRVLHPMGYDAFGLPAENHAIKTGQHPRISTEESIEQFRRQFRSWGISIDWSREFGTHEPSYYRWTQWLFLRFFERGLAYRGEAAVNWCPHDQTVLANEQVIDGRCERCGHVVEVRQLEQWFFKILEYADRLLADLDTIDWPPHVKTMQRNWIGRSEGAEVSFHCPTLGVDYPVFTTRPDTLFGATFFVMAPEHPDVLKLNDSPEVHEYVNRAHAESAEERSDEQREKTGVPLGRTVINPVNGEEIPMFVADYVLMEYGTGAIMAVPAHDDRDFDFAQALELPVRRVVAGGDDDELPWAGEGMGVTSGQFDGLPTAEAKAAIVAWLDGEGMGHASVNYRLRDWLISRQRYWGCPIPVVYCDECGMSPVPESELPVLLPDVEDYAPQGRSPLAAAEDWLRTRCPSCGGEARRETDTMDTFVDSSWYFLRYCDAQNDAAAWDPAPVGWWMPADQYIGGIEHAILHLMYARFFVKALTDMDHLDVQEPFARLFTIGMITREGAKMSKSRGNVISPMPIVERYGADTARSYALFIGPPDQDADWSDEGVEGVYRFLGRLWRIGAELGASGPASGDGAPVAPEGADLELLRKVHWAIDKVSRDMEGRFAFNTAIAAVMELVNACYDARRQGTSVGALRFAVGTAASLVFPFAPHCSADVYDRLFGERVWEQPWPRPDAAFLERDTFELVCQVNGRVRDRVTAESTASQEELAALCRAAPNVRTHVDGREVVKEIVVPGKLVNLVVR